MDSISIIPGGNTGGATEDTGVVGDNPNTAPIESGAFLATTGSIQFADTDTGPGIFHVPFATPIGTTLGTLNVNIFDDATGGADTGLIDWSYAVDNALVQYLAAGQSRVESFDILIVGYDGEEQHVTVSVTLVGTNDGPSMGGSSSSTLTEDAALGVTGNFAFNDVDVLDTHTASVTVAVTGDTTGLALSNGALQALLSTAVTSTTTAANGVLDYTFAGVNEDFQYLKLGETLSLTYTLTIADGQGGTATSTVSINVTGSNDVPTITAASLIGGITEAGSVGVGVSTVSGDASSGGANWVDLDHGEDATLAITQGSFGVSPQSALSFTGGLGTEAVIAGKYGTLYLQANGQYRYVLDNSDVDTQSLDDGSAPTEVFNYTVVGAGAGSVTSTITINIAGTNDAPVLGVVSSPAAFTEAPNASAQTLMASGSFTVTDVDGNDTLTPVASGAVVRLNGNIISSGFPASIAAALNITPATQNSSSGATQTFNWSYMPAASDLDFLSVTDTLTITYPVSVSDGTTAPASQNIVVTINGTNDAPDISISIGDAATGSVTETTGGGLTVSDTLTVTDLDLNDSVTGSITGVSAVGNANGISSAVLQSMLSINSGDLTVPGSNNGQLSWTFNSGAEGFEFLRQGETLALQYTLQVSDGHGGTDVQIVTVTVTGTNDAPALSGVLTPPAAYVDPTTGGAITLAAAGARSGSFVVADADTGDVLEVSDADNNGLTTTDIHAIRSAAVFTWYDVGGLAVLGTSTGLTNGSGGVPFADADTISTIDLGTDDRGDILNAFYVDTAVYNPATQSLTVNWSFDNVTTAAQISVDTNMAGTLPTTIGGINVNFLGNGESLVVVFPITVTDSDGGSTTVNVPITFNGTNDQPALALGAGATGLVDEDTAVVADNPNTGALETGAFVTATGTKTFSDRDANDLLTSVASVTSITPSSGVTISPALTAALNDLSNTFLITQNTTAGTNDGSIVWNFAVDNGLIQGLKDGDSIVVVYRITLSDDSGTATATQTRDVTVTITGTNDGPVAIVDTNALDVVTEGGITPLGAITSGDATATGNLLTNDTDVDLGDTQAVSAGSVGTFVGTYGSVTIAANGTYTYTLNNGDADTNALAVGQVVTDVFNYTMQDSAGATSSSTLTITVTGTNDGPAFTGAPASASFTEEAALTVAGSLAFNDVDITDVHTNTFTVAPSGTITGLALTNAQLLALFSTTTTSTAALSSGSVAWAFAGSNPAFQYLAQGESVTLTYSVTIADGNGGTATQDVAVTVTGENDTPVITVGGTDTATATEALTGDTTVNVSGSFAVTDVDLSNALTVAEGATAVVWSGGSLPSGVLAALTAPGAFVVSDSNAASNAATVNWTLAPGALDLNFLAQGETIIVTVPVTISDGFGGSVLQNVVVTINGTNDSPIITGGGDAGSIIEVAGVTGSGVTSPVSLTGNFTVTDVDDNGTTTIASSFGGFTTNYGPRVTLTPAQQSALAAGLTFSPIVGNDGTITWTYAVANQFVDFLVEAEILTATINVNVTDVMGNVTVTTVAVTITGSNDSVFQTGALNLTGTWSEGSTAAPAITGNFGYTDADFSNHGLQVNNLNTGTLLGAGGTLTASNAANSALDDGTGEVVWSYTLAPGAADYLAVGQSATEIFRVRVIDTAGTPLDQVVTITIQGTNDAPVISTAARDGTMNEDAPAVFSSGSILFNDVDVLDIHTATTSVVVSGDTDGQVFSTASLLSFISTTVNSTTLAANGSVDYTFTPNNAAFQYLQVGQTLTLTYTIAVSDGQGGSASQTVTVNISGLNDGPVAVLNVNGMDVVSEAGAAGAGDGSAAGNVLTNDTDADFGDTQMVAGVQAGSATGPLSTGAASTIIGTYGTINIAANGTYTYTLNNNDTDTQALDDGDVAHDIFSYTVVDSQGVTSTSTIDISIDGSNDAPVIGAFTQPAAVAELVGASAQNIAAITGSFTVTDVDASDTLTPSVAAPVVLLNGVSFAGAPAALLAALNITPATQNSSSGAVQTFNYSYDPAAADLDFLNVGETLTIRYAVSVGDGDDTSNTQNIDITITGTNDTPVAAGVVTAGSALTESNMALTTSGTVTFTDVDAGDIVTATYVPATDGAVSATGIVLTGAQIAAIQSGFSINASGAFTFNLPSPDYLGAGNVVTAVFTVHGTDTHGASTTQDVTLTITGTNDGPTTSIIGTDTVAASLTETNAALSASGAFTVGDLDTFDVDTAAVVGIISSGNMSGLTNTQALAMFTFTSGDLIAQGSSTGSLAWAFNSSATSFDYLRATDVLTLTYQVRVIDSSGANVIQSVDVTINGSNDLPTIASTSSVTGLSEDGTLTATGDASLMSANWNDVDTGEDATLAVTQGSAGAAAQSALTFNGAGAGAGANEATISGTYGTLYLKADGTYRYVLNNADTDTQALDDGQSATDIFNYTISDGSGGTRTSTITANIQGANDSAIITITDLADVTENNMSSMVNFTVASRVAITDIDSLDAASPVLYIPGSGSVLATGGPAAVPGPLGDMVTFDAATGTVSYDRAAFNWLAVGESVTYTVYFDAESGDDGAEAQQLNFTITGQNDAPIAVGEAGTRAENVGGTFAVMANDSDPDLNDTISVTALNVASVNGLGVLTLAEMADIANDFSIVGNQLVFAPSAGLPGSAEAVYDRLNPGQTATIVIAYTVMDNNGGSSIANFTLSITGAAETFTGTALDDNPFNGSNGDDIMFGLNGDDVIFGNSGNDTLYGDQGNDTLNGGSGDDSLYGGVGSDNLIGGSDTDTAFMDGTWASYVIAPGIAPGTYLLTSGGFTDTLTTIELVSFAGGAPVAIATILNDAPVITGANFAIDENIAGPVVLGSVTATDADFPLGDIVSYSITGGNAGGNFAIDPATGVISLVSGQTLDREAAATYPLTVTATDVHGATAAATVTITVNDLNDTLPVFSSGATANVDENAAATTVVYDADATDADATFGPVAYSLSGTDAAAFNIDPVTGEVRLNISADYEVRTNYAINVVATQGATATVQAVAVTINDRNDNNPVFSSNATANLDENTATTTVVYDANATDADATFGPIFYSLSGTDAAAFNIDAVTGEVRLNASADYEARSAYAINVVATQGTTATSRAVTVSVNDLNDNNPAFTSGATGNVDENAATTNVVYDANATDADVTFGPITYSLSGADAAAFNIDAATGEVRLNASADYEVRTNYAINVTATQGATATTQAVAVTINDRNDNNPVFSSGTTASVAENAATTTVVYDANATDADASFGPIAYSLSGADAAAFNIDVVTGEVRLNTSANYEVRTNYAINVVATQGTTSTSRAVTVSVNDVNEFAVGALSFTSVAVNEVSSTGLLASTALAVDGDGTATVSYALLDNAGGRFVINAASGVISVANGVLLDFEQLRSHTVTVRATSSDGSISDGTTTITVNDVNPEMVVGSSANETIIGGAGADNISLAGGNDTLYGRGGDDILNGGAGADRLIGGAGNDVAVYGTALAASGGSIIRAANGALLVNDGSGSVDILSGIEQIQFSDVTLNPAGYARSDINGDGTSDILTYSQSTGLISRTNISNGVVTSAAILASTSQGPGDTASGNWDAQATGDFNYDGTSDLVLKNQVTGQFYIWTFTGQAQTGSSNLGVIGTNWDVLSTADFNRDGNHDILWRNADDGHLYVWTFDAQAQQNGGASLGVLGTNWTGAGVGDFDGDGDSDVMLRNSDNGRLYLYTLENGQLSGGQDINTFGTEWIVGGVGDFNGDGISDVALKNTNTGQFYILGFDTSGSYMGTNLGIIGTQFDIAATGDYNNDGADDILWRNTTNNQVSIGLMEDGNQAGGGLGLIGVFASDLIIV